MNWQQYVEESPPGSIFTLSDGRKMTKNKILETFLVRKNTSEMTVSDESLKIDQNYFEK